MLPACGRLPCCSMQTAMARTRLLDPSSDVTLSTLERAAALVGRKLSITLV